MNRLLATNLLHTLGDLFDDEVPVWIEYEHDERGTQHLEIKAVRTSEGAVILVAGGLVKLPAREGPAPDPLDAQRIRHSEAVHAWQQAGQPGGPAACPRFADFAEPPATSLEGSAGP